MSKRLRRWIRTLHTIKYLQPRQAWYFFLRRGVGASKVRSFELTICRRDISISPTLYLTDEEGDSSTYHFTFLNHILSFPRGSMNWCPTQAQRLWRYNLHYFDFLRDPERPLAQKIALIDDWMRNNPQGSEPAWEPYTTSLRIVNWCLFFSSLPSESISEAWLHSLHLQARWLERNLELHILANHYLENIKAMLFAAIFFDDVHSTRWLRRFQSELISQLREQTLADGGHYERSPQYHCVLLEGYLDIYALMRQNVTLVEAESLAALHQSIDSGLKFLGKIATPDDDIPLFNDSASGAASRPSIIFEKAQLLGFHTAKSTSTLIDLPESGLFGWKSGNDFFLIDCGDIGPAYQPGHTHCDFLSFVLMIDSQWIVVDSGVCEYEPGPWRNYVRSTLAHNTVSVGNSEQSEIWGEFRVGRRARSLGASISRVGNQIIFEGSYRGFPTLAADIVHSRRVILTLDTTGGILQLDIDDTIGGTSKGLHEVIAAFHLHPSLTAQSTAVTVENIHRLSIGNGSTVLAEVDSEVSTSASIESSWYCPEFGKKQKNICIQLHAKAPLPIHFSSIFKLNR